MTLVRWLAIDTSGGTTAGLVLTGDGAPEVLAGASNPDPRAHVEALAPMIQRVLADAGVTASDVDAVAVGTGPAPFTGLRVGLASAAAFARARRVPVHGVCSLDAIAVGCEQDAVVVTDARRREVYWAAYRGGLPPEDERWRVHDPAVGPASQVTDWLATHGGVLLGPGAALVPDLPAGTGPADPAVVTPTGLVTVAAALVRAGRPTPLQPRYLRRPDIHTSAGRKRAS